MIVFKLDHVRKVAGRHCTDTTGIGYFDSERSAQDAIRQLLNQPGFCDFSEDFRMEKLSVPDIEKTETQSYVYDVWHEWALDADTTYVTFLGVYAKESSAQNRIAKSRRSEKFRKHPDGFGYARNELNQISWQEGFVIE